MRDATSCGDRREQDRGHGQTKSKRAEEAKDLIEGEELLAKREPEKQDRLTTWESGHGQELIILVENSY